MINKEWLRINDLAHQDFLTGLHKVGDLQRLLNYRKLMCQQWLRYENKDKLVLEAIKNIDDMILEYLNIPR